MMPLSFQHYFSLALALFCLTVTGCKDYAGHGGVSQRIKEATAAFQGEESVGAFSLAAGKTVLVKTKYQGIVFWTETRKAKIERFKCSHCHNNKEVHIEKAAEMAHGDIAMIHGEQGKQLACSTCHKQDERDFLITEKGVKVDFDHSYQMCGQCHFRQKKDWVGGAHGKRVSHWAGKRVVKNCTHCHNPHSPRFEKRWPRTYSLPISE
ncbi:MAG: hypothetical protein JRH15_09145 [Deltaproteobacteria bacterium]|nr:hypothetical protein [Deltaproteobacteria bacterium]